MGGDRGGGLDGVEALGSGHLMQGERGFACCGQKCGYYPKRYAEPLQAVNCIYTEHL